MKTYIGLDLGTSGVKALLVDEFGNILKESNKTYPIIYDKENYVEQNPQEWFDKTLLAIEALLSNQNKDDVIFTFDTHQNNYLETQEGKNLPIEHCIKNSDGWELYGKVNTAKKEYDICIEKTNFGSLELGNYLKDKVYSPNMLIL